MDIMRSEACGTQECVFRQTLGGMRLTEEEWDKMKKEWEKNGVE